MNTKGERGGEGERVGEREREQERERVYATLNVMFTMCFVDAKNNNCPPQTACCATEVFTSRKDNSKPSHIKKNRLPLVTSGPNTILYALRV